MAYYDQHMHSYFSPDSSEQFERYLEQTDGILVTTEHLDFTDPFNEGKDTILDYEAYTQKIEELNQTYGDRIRKGIEVGYTKESLSQIQEYLEGKAFDVILLSVHQNGEYDYLMPEVDSKDPKEVMREYFALCTEAVEQVDQANVFAHFDYGIRRLAVSLDDLKQFEPQLKELLERIIERKMALELNTSSMYKHGNVDLYRYVAELYFNLGGTRFSLGSDAHSADRYRDRFDDAVELLKEIGVVSVVQYKNGEEQLERLDEPGN